MRLHELLEATEERDARLRKQAEEFADLAEEAISKYRDDRFIIKFIDGDEIDPRYKNLRVAIDREGNLTDAAALITKHKAQKNVDEWDATPAQKKLWMANHFGSADYLLVVGPDILEDHTFHELHDAIIHEFIHYLDIGKRFKTKDFHVDSYEESPKKYYNSPAEFNAYYQQGASRALKNVKVNAKKGNLKDLKYYTSDEFINGNWSKEWYAQLKPAMKKRFKKRLANLYHSINTEHSKGEFRSDLWKKLIKPQYEKMRDSRTQHEFFKKVPPKFENFMGKMLPRYIKDKETRQAIKDNKHGVMRYLKQQHTRMVKMAFDLLSERPVDDE